MSNQLFKHYGINHIRPLAYRAWYWAAAYWYYIWRPPRCFSAIKCWLSRQLLSSLSSFWAHHNPSKPTDGRKRQAKFNSWNIWTKGIIASFFFLPISKNIKSADFVTSDLNNDEIILISIRKKVVKKILNNISPNFN